MICWLLLLLLGEVEVLLSRLLLDSEVLAGGCWRLLVVASCLGLHHLLQVRLALVLDVLLPSHSHWLGHHCLPVLDTTGEHWSH